MKSHNLRMDWPELSRYANYFTATVNTLEDRYAVVCISAVTATSLCHSYKRRTYTNIHLRQWRQVHKVYRWITRSHCTPKLKDPKRIMLHRYSKQRVTSLCLLHPYWIKLHHTSTRLQLESKGASILATNWRTMCTISGVTWKTKYIVIIFVLVPTQAGNEDEEKQPTN